MGTSGSQFSWILNGLSDGTSLGASLLWALLVFSGEFQSLSKVLCTLQHSEFIFLHRLLSYLSAEAPLIANFCSVFIGLFLESPLEASFCWVILGLLLSRVSGDGREVK